MSILDSDQSILDAFVNEVLMIEASNFSVEIQEPFIFFDYRQFRKN